jgi:hypothetical protein
MQQAAEERQAQEAADCDRYIGRSRRAARRRCRNRNGLRRREPTRTKNRKAEQRGD